jgi:hypothetical protein
VRTSETMEFSNMPDANDTTEERLRAIDDASEPTEACHR